jgi:hypothetical protein
MRYWISAAREIEGLGRRRTGDREVRKRGLYPRENRVAIPGIDKIGVDFIGYDRNAVLYADIPHGGQLSLVQTRRPDCGGCTDKELYPVSQYFVFKVLQVDGIALAVKDQFV